ncbi:hypothetical protein HYU19_00345 [Candidatus Woesearchaeota archaeon]|nr:hypothetical protein [Candidatus Woesearchaeota archaeon]
MGFTKPSLKKAQMAAFAVVGIILLLAVLFLSFSVKNEKGESLFSSLFSTKQTAALYENVEQQCLALTAECSFYAQGLNGGWFQNKPLGDEASFRQNTGEFIKAAYGSCLGEYSKEFDGIPVFQTTANPTVMFRSNGTLVEVEKDAYLEARGAIVKLPFSTADIQANPANAIHTASSTSLHDLQNYQIGMPRTVFQAPNDIHVLNDTATRIGGKPYLFVFWR